MGSKETIHKCTYTGYNFYIITRPETVYNLNLVNKNSVSCSGYDNLQDITEELLNWQDIALEDYLNILKMKEQLNAS